MEQKREVWSGRSMFILAAIGSAVGLGNIWRFPYVAYESGGGAFMIPYLVALLTAGIPLLFLDYAIGHRFRGSPPQSFRRLHPRAEAIGWWQVGICFVIGIYYAVIIAWAMRYTLFSATLAWGDDPQGFLFGDFLKLADEPGIGTDVVMGVAVPLVIVWVVTLLVIGIGVQKGIGLSAKIFVPLLVILFAGLVVRALFLEGAWTGIDALFTPDWSALTNTTVWIAAYGQIFFSLSVAFGIMITYSSYLKLKSNLTGSALVVGFSNSGFEILAGIGVFAALGFMAATAAGGPVPVDEVVEGGIGLAFIAFPQLISTMPGGAYFGVLFFLCLVFAGLTSLISIVEVVVSAVRDKLGIGRVPAVALVGGTAALLSLALLPTTTGLYVLDIVDKFANNVGIVGVALVTLVVVSWLFPRLGELIFHVNSVSSFKLGFLWRAFVGVVTPLVLAYMLGSEMLALARDGYDGYPTHLVALLGWAAQAALVVLAVLLSLAPWRGPKDTFLAHPPHVPPTPTPVNPLRGRHQK